VGQPAVVAEDDAAGYQEVKSGDIPLIVDDDGTRARVVCDFLGAKGPVDGIACRSDLPGTCQCSRPEKDAAGRDDAARIRVCVRWRGEVCNASGPLAVPTEGVGWADKVTAAEAEKPLAGVVR